MNEKSGFFGSFFRNISKTAETIFIKTIGRNHGISLYKKALISNHRKNDIFRDNNCFVKRSVSLLRCIDGSTEKTRDGKWRVLVFKGGRGAGRLYACWITQASKQTGRPGAPAAL